jgi:hypothetical protein
MGGKLQALGVSFCFRFSKSFKLKTSNGSIQTAGWPQDKRMFEAFKRRHIIISNRRLFA